MGLHASDLVKEVARVSEGLAGVCGIWSLEPTDRDGSVWVLIKGPDGRSHEEFRLRCVRAIQDVLRGLREEMRSAGVILDYQVTTDSPDFRDWLTQQGAHPVA